MAALKFFSKKTINGTITRQDEELKQKIVMMMTFRMVIIITLLGSAILIQLVSRTILPINPLYFLIFLTSFFTLVSAVWFAKVQNLRVLAYLQLSGDVIVITLLLYFTGGVRSPFSFLYILGNYCCKYPAVPERKPLYCFYQQHPLWFTGRSFILRIHSLLRSSTL